MKRIIAGPLLFVCTIFALQKVLGFPEAVAFATVVWMGIWWILRPVGIAVTALLPIVINSLFSLVPMEQVISQYFSEIIVLLFGASLVCLTWTTTGLDKRLSLKALCCIGTSIRQQIAVWLFASAILSVFLPNAVVCTIMIPVAVSMLKFLGEKDIGSSRLAVPILLAIAWGAGIGGFGSPLGGAANLVAIYYIEQLTGQEFMYVDWVIRFVPILAIILVVNLLYLYSIKLPITHVKGTKDYFRKQYAELSSMQYGEKISLALFIIATVLSFVRPLYAEVLPGMKPAYVFMLMGMLTFVLKDEKLEPLLTWKQAEDGMMWAMLYLFSGGLALGKLITGTGAANKIAALIAQCHITSEFYLVVLFVVFTCFLSEISSNTAAAAIATPIVLSITQTLGLNVIPYLLITIVAFNNAYVLPVSVRAIPVGYGLHPDELMKHGIKLAVLTTLTIILIGYGSMQWLPLFNSL